MKAKGGYLYIQSNISRSTFYIGVTATLSVRSHQHMIGEGSKFTSKYRCTDLVYYEFYESIEEAFIREKQIKKWKREWKLRLIKEMNPTLKDLYDEVADID